MRIPLLSFFATACVAPTIAGTTDPVVIVHATPEGDELSRCANRLPAR